MKNRRTKTKTITLQIPGISPGQTVPIKASLLRKDNGLYVVRKQVNGKIFYGYGMEEVTARKNFIDSVASKDSAPIHESPQKNTIVSQPFGEWLDEWLNNHLRIGNKPMTYHTYKSIVTNHIKPWVGDIDLKELRECNFQQMCAKIRQHRSQSTTAQALFICRSALNSAVNEGLILQTPIHHLSVKRKLVRERIALTPEEAMAFLASIRTHRLSTAFATLIVCGLRRNELLGLRWENVNLEKGYLQIIRGLFRIKRVSAEKPVEFSSPKTDTSVRSVPLPDWLVNELQKHKLQQIKDYKKQCSNFPLELVFCRLDGRPYYPDYLSKLFKKLLMKAGLRQAKLHDLRRTCATLALNSGSSPRTVAELLGHASTRMVNEIYTVSSVNDKKLAVDSISTVLLPNSSNKTIEIPDIPLPSLNPSKPVH